MRAARAPMVWAALGAVLTVAACEPVDDPAGPAAANTPDAAAAQAAGAPPEDYFVVESDGSELRGTYNPAGWTATDIQRYAGANCPSGRLVSYGEAPAGNGLVRFGGDCG